MAGVERCISNGLSVKGLNGNDVDVAQDAIFQVLDPECERDREGGSGQSKQAGKPCECLTCPQHPTC